MAKNRKSNTGNNVFLKRNHAKPNECRIEPSETDMKRGSTFTFQAYVGSENVTQKATFLYFYKRKEGGTSFDFPMSGNVFLASEDIPVSEVYVYAITSEYNASNHCKVTIYEADGSAKDAVLPDVNNGSQTGNSGDGTNGKDAKTTSPDITSNTGTSFTDVLKKYWWVILIVILIYRKTKK
jgi:hypothetical protein